MSPQSEYEVAVADAWDGLTREARLHMWGERGLSDLYFACARLAARREADEWVAEVVDGRARKESK